MRPVDRLPGAAHAFFDQTFDNRVLAAGPMLEISDFVWNSAPGDADYTFFRNGQTWPPPPPPGLQTPGPNPQVAWNSAGFIHYFGSTPIPGQDLGMVNRDNTGNLIINVRFDSLQIDQPRRTNGATPRWVRIRVVMPPIEASDLVRAWEDGHWNGAAPGAIPVSVKDRVRGETTKHGITVPNVQAPAGTYYGYRGAIRDLEATIGRYCSFCECKGQDGPTLDVEHRLAKASYPSDILDWENYLLACVICNSRFKLERPNRQFGISTAIQAYHPAAGIVYPVPPPPGDNPDFNLSPVIPPGPGVIPYWEMRQACNEYHAWPSLNDGAAGAPVAPATNYSLLCFNYHLREYDGAGNPVRLIPLADSVNRNNNSTGNDGPHGTVQANVWDSTLVVPALRLMNVRVEVEARNPGTGHAQFDPRKQTAANNTIDMVGLNGFANAFGDRRMLERTYAWFRAIQDCVLLRDQLPLAISRSDLDVTKLWNRIADAAEGGYYSVWLKVFRASVGPQMATKLAQTLDARAADATPFRYKGTNLVNSVTPFIRNI